MTVVPAGAGGYGTLVGEEVPVRWQSTTYEKTYPQEVHVSETKACATCFFWEEQSNRCRRYAPHPALGNSEDSDGSQNAFWVLTKAEDWCGDYESILGEEYEEEEEHEEEDDEEWEADGSLKWSPPPPAPPAQRGLFR